MPSIYLKHTPNPFGLPQPKDWWLKPIADYDPDLRIYPSQTHPCYRLARVARYSGGMSHKTFSKIPGIAPDTKVALEQRLVPVTTIPPAALTAPPQNIVQQLRSRDQWTIGGGQDGSAADKVADLLDQRDEANEAGIHQQRVNDGRMIHESARVSLLYRTGARVSLIRPPAFVPKAASPSEGARPADSPAVGSTAP